MMVDAADSADAHEHRNASDTSSINFELIEQLQPFEQCNQQLLQLHQLEPFEFGLLQQPQQQQQAALQHEFIHTFNEDPRVAFDESAVLLNNLLYESQTEHTSYTGSAISGLELTHGAHGDGGASSSDTFGLFGVGEQLNPGDIVDTQPQQIPADSHPAVISQWTLPHDTLAQDSSARLAAGMGDANFFHSRCVGSTDLLASDGVFSWDLMHENGTLLPDYSMSSVRAPDLSAHAMQWPNDFTHQHAQHAQQQLQRAHFVLTPAPTRRASPSGALHALHTRQQLGAVLAQQPPPPLPPPPPGPRSSAEFALLAGIVHWPTRPHAQLAALQMHPHNQPPPPPPPPPPLPLPQPQMTAEPHGRVRCGSGGSAATTVLNSPSGLQWPAESIRRVQSPARDSATSDAVEGEFGASVFTSEPCDATSSVESSLPAFAEDGIIQSLGNLGALVRPEKTRAVLVKAPRCLKMDADSATAAVLGTSSVAPPSDAASEICAQDVLMSTSRRAYSSTEPSIRRTAMSDASSSCEPVAADVKSRAIRSNARASKQVKRACFECRRICKKCDDTRPCVRCANAGIECVDVPRKTRVACKRGPYRKTKEREAIGRAYSGNDAAGGARGDDSVASQTSSE